MSILTIYVESSLSIFIPQKPPTLHCTICPHVQHSFGIVPFALHGSSFPTIQVALHCTSQFERKDEWIELSLHSFLMSYKDKNDVHGPPQLVNQPKYVFVEKGMQLEKMFILMCLCHRKKKWWEHGFFYDCPKLWLSSICGNIHCQIHHICFCTLPCIDDCCPKYEIVCSRIIEDCFPPRTP